MNYRWSKPEELNMYVRKIVSSVSSFHKEISLMNKNEDYEERITANYLFLDKCYMGLQEAKVIESCYRTLSATMPKHIQQTLSSVKNLYQSSINEVLSKLSEICEKLCPDSYKNDINEIGNLLDSEPSKSCIFPKNDSIIIYTVFPYKKKNIIFSTVYRKNEIKKYVGQSSTNFVLPGKFQLGREIQNLEDVLRDENAELNKIIIQSSVLTKNRVLLKIREGFSIESAKAILKAVLASFTDSILSIDDSVIVQFNKLSESNIKEISKMLCLSNNDKYLMLSMQGE